MCMYVYSVLQKTRYPIFFIHTCIQAFAVITGINIPFNPDISFSMMYFIILWTVPLWWTALQVPSESMIMWKLVHIAYTHFMYNGSWTYTSYDAYSKIIDSMKLAIVVQKITFYSAIRASDSWPSALRSTWISNQEKSFLAKFCKL